MSRTHDINGHPIDPAWPTLWLDVRLDRVDSIIESLRRYGVDARRSERTGETHGVDVRREHKAMAQRALDEMYVEYGEEASDTQE